MFTDGAKETRKWVISVVAITISAFFTGFFAIYAVKEFWQKNMIVKNSFNDFIDEAITDNSLGAIIYDINYKILWTSGFIKNRFGRNWVGTSLTDFFHGLGVKFQTEQSTQIFTHEKASYEVKIWSLKNYLTIRDNTIETEAIKIYDSQLPVIGELEIDNYQLYQSILSEPELYILNKSLIGILDNLVGEYNLVYRQYTNSKFLLFTNKESIEKMKDVNFNFFSKLHNIFIKSKQNNFKMSISVGFAEGFKNFWEKTEQAKNALLQAQSRGGDQVAIYSNLSRPKYYGSSSEILYDISRVKIKSIANLIETKLNDPSIKRVICYGHANADLDAIGSSLGIWSLAKQFKKEAYICSITQDSTTKKVMKKVIPNPDEIFIKPQLANKLTDESTLVFLLDISDPKRTDNPECISNTKTNNIFILDHHRLGTNVDFCSKTNRFISPSASSASEIVTEVLMFVQKKLKLEMFVAQMLLNGIYLDTLQFTKHVNARSFIAAAWLEERGADSTASSEALKIDESTQNKINKLLENIQEVKPGYFLAYKDIPLSNDVISIAAEEVLKISGRKAAFIVARLENTSQYKMSARSLFVNVQLIAEEVGGGGHFGTAAAVSNEEFDVFIDNIKQAIVSSKHESYIN